MSCDAFFMMPVFMKYGQASSVSYLPRTAYAGACPTVVAKRWTTVRGGDIARIHGVFERLELSPHIISQCFGGSSAVPLLPNIHLV